VKKAIITLEPYLKHYYAVNIGRNTEDSKAFHILGLDILIDRKNKAWLMEINSNPSLNIFLEKDVEGVIKPEKQLQEIDKYIKERVMTEAIRLVCDQGDGEFEGCFEQLLPDANMADFYVWNKG
jgi:hypothetical protein